MRHNSLPYITLRVGFRATPVCAVPDETCDFDDFPGPATWNGLGLQAVVTSAFRGRVELVYLASRYTPLSWISGGLGVTFWREGVSSLRGLRVLRVTRFPWLAPWALSGSPLRG